MATAPGGALSRRTVLAGLAAVAATAGGPLPATPRATPAAHGAEFSAALREPMARRRTALTRSAQYTNDLTPWGHLFVTDRKTGQRTPVATDYGRLAAFGSSTMDYAGPVFAGEFRGMPFHQGGRAGEVAEETLARLGSRPLRMDAVTIPAVGEVVVRTWTPFGVGRSLVPYSGTLAGVRGTLATRGRNPRLYTFTRTHSGAPVEVQDGTAFLPDHGQRGAILLLNVGKNNLSGARGTQNVDKLLRWTRDAVVWNGRANTLVLGHFVDTETRRRRSALRRRVTEYNTVAHDAFGDQFFDLGEFLTSSEVWDYAGISPTSADRRRQKAGNKPPSLSRDNKHLNPAGEAAVARRVHEHLVGLGWLRDRSGG